MANLRSPYQALTPYEADQDIPIPNSPYAVHDGDTVVDPRTGKRFRQALLDSNEMYNPYNGGHARQQGAREATEAAANYYAEHGFDPNVTGTDTTGTRGVDMNPDFAEYMVDNGYADPSIFPDAPPEAADRIRRAAMGHNLSLLHAPNGELRTRDFATDPLPGPKPRPMGLMQSLANGVSRGIDVLQGDLYGAGHALARAVDSIPGLEGKNAKTLAWTKEGMDRNASEAEAIPARFNSYHDIKGVGDVLPYAAEKVAESLPSMLPMIAGGVVAGGIKAASFGTNILGAAAGTLERAAIKKAAFTGSTVLGALPHAGEIEQEQAKLKDPINPLAVAGGALVNSALDTFGVGKGLEAMTHAVAPVGSTLAAKALDVSKQLAKSVGITTGTEGVTESLQEITNIGLHAAADPSYDPLKSGSAAQKDAISRIKESFVGGAAAGGLMGGMARGAGIAMAKPEEGLADSQELGSAENPGNTGGQDALSTPDDGLDTLRNLAGSANMWDSLKGGGLKTNPGLAQGIRDARQMGFTPNKNSGHELFKHLLDLANEHGPDAVHGMLEQNEITIPPKVRAMFDFQAPRTGVNPEVSTHSNPEMPPENIQEGSTATNPNMPPENNQDISSNHKPSNEAPQPTGESNGKVQEIPSEVPVTQEGSGKDALLEPSSSDFSAEHPLAPHIETLHAHPKWSPNRTASVLHPEHQSIVDDVIQNIKAQHGIDLSHIPVFSFTSTKPDAEEHTAFMNPVVLNGRPSLHLNESYLKTLGPKMLSRVIAHELGHVIDSEAAPESPTALHSSGLGSIDAITAEFDAVRVRTNPESDLHKLLSHPLLDKYDTVDKQRREYVADAFSIALHHPEFFNERFPETSKYLQTLLARRAGMESRAGHSTGPNPASNQEATTGISEKAPEPDVGVRGRRAVGDTLGINLPRIATENSDAEAGDVQGISNLNETHTYHSNSLRAQDSTGNTAFTDLFKRNNRILGVADKTKRGVTSYKPAPTSEAALLKLAGEIHPAADGFTIETMESGDRIAVPEGSHLEETLNSNHYAMLEHNRITTPKGERSSWILRSTANHVGLPEKSKTDELLIRAANPAIRVKATRISVPDAQNNNHDYDAQGLTHLGHYIDSGNLTMSLSVSAKEAYQYFLAGLGELSARGYKVDMSTIHPKTIIYRTKSGSPITLGDYKSGSDSAIGNISNSHLTPGGLAALETGAENWELDRINREHDKYQRVSDKQQERSGFHQGTVISRDNHGNVLNDVHIEEADDPYEDSTEIGSPKNPLPDNISLAPHKQQGAADPDNAVLSTQYHANTRLVGWLESLAKLVGIKAQFHVMDEAGIEKYKQELRDKITLLRNSGSKTASEFIGKYKVQLHTLEMADFDRGKFLSLDTAARREDRVPILFVSSQLTAPAQIRVAAHEFGHFVQRAAVDQLIKKAETSQEAKQVVAELFGDINWADSTAVIRAEEMFAENVRHWATTSMAPKTAIEKFFHHMGQLLEIVRNWYNKQAPSAQYANVAAFMDAMVQSTGVTHIEQGPITTAARNSVLSAAREAMVVDFNKMMGSARTTKARAEMRSMVAPYLAALKNIDTRMARPTQIELSKGEQYKDVVASLNKTGFLEQRSEIADQNWGAEELYQGTKALYKTTASKVANGKYSKAPVETLGNLWEGIKQVSPTLISLDSELRAMNSMAADFLANAFRFQPGKGQVIGKTTIHADLQALMGELHPELAKVLAALPKPPSIFSEGLNFGKASAKQKAEIAAYKRIALEANKNLPLDQITDLNLRTQVEALRTYHTMLIDKFNNQHGMNIKERKNYYTGVIDHDKWQRGETEIQKILVAKGMTVRQAKETWDAVLFSDGVLVPLDLSVAGTVYAPNLSARNPRFFEPEVHTALAAFYSDDIHGTLLNYTRSLSNRAVMQKHFGGYAIDTNTMAFVKGTDNKFVYDPMGKLNFMLDKSKLLYSAKHGNQGGLTPAQYLRIKQDVIPALMGTKGAQSITPTTRAVMSWTKTYFNMSLLGLCTLSSINDLGGMHMKVLQHKDVLPKFALVKAMLRQASKEGNDMNLYARMLGSVSDNYIESVMAGDEHNGFMVPGAQRVNNAFFRAIGMKWWTDTTRSTALILARDTLSELGTKAARGDAKAAAELSQYGLSANHVLDWIQSETVGNVRTIDTTGTKTTDLIKAALNTYVDQAVLRPSASSRPVVGSDQRMQLIWYLNDFMYSFYETTMRVTMASMAQEQGLARIIPLIALGAVMLPLAAVGYELRKLIARDLPSELLGLPDNTKDPETVADYTWEMMQRSGMLGPAQKLVDYEETDARGKLAIISLLGPIVESMVTMLDKGFPYFISHTAPVLGQSRVLRDSWGRSLEKTLDVGEPNNQKKAES